MCRLALPVAVRRAAFRRHLRRGAGRGTLPGMRAAAIVAAAALAAMGCRTVGEQTPVAREIARLGSADPAERAEAAASLESMGAEAAIASPALVTALGDPERPVREAAQSALMAFGMRALDPLVDALGDANRERRGRAVVILGRLGPPALPAAAGLERILRGDDREIRRDAAFALTRITGRDYRFDW